MKFAGKSSIHEIYNKTIIATSQVYEKDHITVAIKSTIEWEPIHENI